MQPHSNPYSFYCTYWFNRNTGQLLDDITGSVQIDQSLVDAHFKLVPSIGTFSTGRLTGRNRQTLGGHTNGSRDMKLLVEGDLFEIRADLFNVADIATRQSDTNAVDGGTGASGFFASFFLGRVCRHVE